MSEKDWQAQVVQLAGTFGWMVQHSRPAVGQRRSVLARGAAAAPRFHSQQLDSRCIHIAQFNKRVEHASRIAPPPDARHHHIVLAVVNQECTVKRLYRRGGVVKLLAENPIYPALVFQPDQELSIWGVVTFNLHKLT